MPKIMFLKNRLSLHVKEGTELLQVFKLHNGKIPLRFGCCQGNCGTCAIRVNKGAENLSPKSKHEMETLGRIEKQGERLACQCAVLGDVEIDS